MLKTKRNFNRRFRQFGVLSLLLCGGFFAFSPPAWAATVGPNNAGTGTDVVGVGTVAWGTPENITATGTPYAVSASIPKGGEVTHYIFGSNYGFNIPNGAEINGIQVMIRRSSSVGTNLRDSVVQIIKGGLLTGNNAAHSSTNWPTTLATATYGGATDLWGGVWTSADINSADFGVALSASNVSIFSTRTATVDYIQITVYYTPDTIAPIINMTPAIADQTIEATGISTNPFLDAHWLIPTVSDNTDPAPVLAYSPNPAVFPVSGGNTVTWTATDWAGNISTTTTNITVNDTIAPVLSGIPSDIIAEGVSPAGVVVNYVTPTAADLADPAPEVDCAPLSGSIFALGTTTVSCIALDASGNQSPTSTFEVIVRDTVAPLITANGTNPLNLHVGDIYIEAGASATDAVDGTDAVVTSGDIVNTAIPGVYQVYYDTADVAGNQATRVIETVTVSDVTAPIINAIADITIKATGPGGAVVDYGTITATDDVDGTNPINASDCSLPTGSVFPIGSTAVICSVTDSSGNHAFGSALTVTVNKADQIIYFAPIFGKTYGDADFDVTATSDSGLFVSLSVGSSTACSISGSTIHIIGAGSCVVTATQAGNAVYNAAIDAVQTLMIGKKVITVIADNKVKDYGQTDPALTYVSDPLVGADAFTGVLGRIPGESVGNYEIIINSLTAGNNYDVSFIGANLSIKMQQGGAVPVFILQAMSDAEHARTNSQPVSQGVDSNALAISVIAQPRVLGVSAYNFSRSLGWGSFGNDVKVLQQFLINHHVGQNAVSLANWGATGYFGPYTKMALYEYQISVGLPANGFFGAITRDYINNLSE